MSNDISIHDVSDDIDVPIPEPKSKPKPKPKPKFGDAQPKKESNITTQYMTPNEISKVESMSKDEIELAIAKSTAEAEDEIIAEEEDTIIATLNLKPGEFREVKLKSKTMGNTDQSGCRDNVPDVVMFGDDLFKLLSKASSESEGWFKSTKAMEVGRGCVVQVTTQQRNPDGSYSVAEALSFVPGVRLIESKGSDGIVTGRRLK